MRKVWMTFPALFMAVGIFVGFSMAAFEHGDWLLTRGGDGCRVFDRETQKYVGTWPVHPDGRCHIGLFLWKWSFTR